jgi:hypothetical protein
MTEYKEFKFYCVIEDAYGFQREIVWNASSFAEAEKKCKELGDIQLDERIKSIEVEYD